MTDRTGTTPSAAPGGSRRLGAVSALALVTVMAVLALAGIAAGSRPWASAPAHPTTDAQTAAPPASVAPSPPADKSTDPSGPPARLVRGDPFSGYLVLALTSVLVLGILVLVGRRAGRLRRRSAARAASRAGPGTPPADPLPEAVDRALVAVDIPDAREAVVRAWLLLGEAAAAAGTPARSAETAAEYARRLAQEQRLPSSSLEHLAELYREARFSDHQVRPDQRTEARAELEVLRSALAADARTADR